MSRPPRIILAIDTALQHCNIAIVADRDGQGAARVLARHVVPVARGQGEVLAPLVAIALEEAALAVGDLERIVVTVGPGGFTGVRVGLAFARGLALGPAVGPGVCGVTSLEGLAATLAAHKTLAAGTLIAPVIDARRGEVYLAVYQTGPDGALTERLAPVAIAPEAAGRIMQGVSNESAFILIGSGVGLIGALASRQWRVDDETCAIDPVVLALLGARKPLPDASPAPLYLRAPDAVPSAKPLFAALGMEGS